MTPKQLKAARKQLRLTARGLVDALGITGIGSDRTVRLWEAVDGSVPGPVAVAVRYMMKEAGLIK